MARVGSQIAQHAFRGAQKRACHPAEL